MELKSLRPIDYVGYSNYVVKDVARQYSIIMMANRNISNDIIYNIRENTEDSKLYKHYTDYIETILPSEVFEIDRDLMVKLFILKCFKLDDAQIYKEADVDNIKMVKTNPFELLSSIYNTYMLDGLKFRIYPVRKISKMTMYCPIEIELVDSNGRCKYKASSHICKKNQDPCYTSTVDDYSNLLKTESIDPVLTKFHNFFSFISKRKEFVNSMLDSRIALGVISETGYLKLLTFSKKYTISNIENFHKLLKYDCNNDNLSNPKLIRLTKLIKSLPSKPRFRFTVTINAIHIVIDCGVGIVSKKNTVNWAVSIPSQRMYGRSHSHDSIESNMINIFLKGLEEFDAVDIVINKLEMKLLSII